MYDAFISYRRKNGFAVAKMLRDQLKLKKISAFVDLDELRNGTFDDKILTAIKNSPSFLLILFPGDLDRCAEDDDWLTKEITAAVDSGRNIIPILCDGFKWPKHWNDDIPEKIRVISKFNSVNMSYEYLDAMIAKIISYINDDSSDSSEEALNTHTNDTNAFFTAHLRDIDSIESVELSFHAGFIWHQDIGHLDILSTLAEAEIPVRIIVNTAEGAMIIGKHMRHKLKRYPSFDEGIASWKHISSVYDSIQVKLSEIPLMRICYCINKKDSEKSVMRVKFYTYGNPKIDSNFIQDFSPADHPFELYKKEFEYLWSNATD